ncbi:MAG: RDD family protein [Opitutales bacterium]
MDKTFHYRIQKADGSEQVGEIQAKNRDLAEYKLKQQFWQDTVEEVLEGPLPRQAPAAPQPTPAVMPVAPQAPQPAAAGPETAPPAAAPGAADVPGELGGAGQRLGAFILDSIFVSLITLPLFIVAGVLSGVAGAAAGEDAAAAVAGLLGLLANLAIFFIQWLYFAIQEAGTKQATWGKRICGIIVTDLNGNRISFWRATGRYFSKILSGLIFLIGYLMILFTQKKQGLHDIIAGTLVLNGKR